MIKLRRVVRNLQRGGFIGGLGAEPPAFENFVYFWQKNNLILGLFW